MNSPTRISVESFGANKIQVRGFETGVNGVPNAIASFTGLAGGVIIRLNGGNDLVRITNVILPGQLVIDLGAGNDEAVMGHDKPGGDARFGNTPTGHLATYGNLYVYGRAGNDLVYQSYYHAKKPALLDLGEGDDTLRIRRLAGENLDTQYRGTLRILTRTGSNVVDLNGVLAQTNVTLLDDAGQVQVIFRNVVVQGDFFANLGNGNDSVVFSGVETRRLTLRAGAGHDLYSIQNTHATDAVFSGEASSILSGFHLAAERLQFAAANLVRADSARCVSAA